jgi:hypothetical protein
MLPGLRTFGIPSRRMGHMGCENYVVTDVSLDPGSKTEAGMVHPSFTDGGIPEMDAQTGGPVLLNLKAISDPEGGKT